MEKTIDKAMRAIQSKQNGGDMCVVCGKENPMSLCTDFYVLEGNVLLGVTVGKEIHQSYPDRMHGGLITALLDEAIGRAVQIDRPDLWGVTGKIEVTFKKPVRLGIPLYCYGRIVKMSALSFVGKGYIEDGDGTVLATGTATYVKASIEKMTEGKPMVWKIYPDSFPRPEAGKINHPELLDMEL